MRLYQGDCLEIMRDIPDGSIDMILCDLPYGTTANAWDKVIPFPPLWEAYRRITKPHSAIVLFSQEPFTSALTNSNLKEFRYEWIWKKSIATGFLNAKKAPLKAHENICVFYRKLPTYNPQFWYSTPYSKKQHTSSSNYRTTQGREPTVSEDGRRYPLDVLLFSNSRDRGSHPTQKPVALLEYLIKTYTNEGETVLDNCMGSGSTGVACANTGRDFIGIELDAGYFQTAKRRIETARQKIKEQENDAK